MANSALPQFMVADADVVKAEVAQDVLGLLDHAELLRGDGFAVGDARAEAGHLGFVGRGQAELGGERADVGFGQAGLFEGGADLEFRGGLGAGTVIADIAGVLAVGDDGQTFGFGQRGKLGEELVFAEVAAVVGVGQVAGVFEFAGADDAHRELELAGEGQGLLKFTAGQAGRIGNRGEGLVPQHVVRDIGEKDRIHAAGVGDEAGAVGAQESAQPFIFFPIPQAQNRISGGKSRGETWCVKRETDVKRETGTLVRLRS